MNLRRWMGAMAWIVAVAAGSPAFAGPPRVTVNCDVDARGSHCVFVNRGTAPARNCVTLHLTNGGTHQSITSERICSQTLAPRATESAQVDWGSGSPQSLCMTGHPPTWADCLVNLDIGEPEVPWVPIGTAGTVLLLGLGVFVDAWRLGAKKGLVRGFFDLSAASWGAAATFLPVIGLVAYATRRGAIKRAVVSGPPLERPPSEPVQQKKRSKPKRTKRYNPTD